MKREEIIAYEIYVKSFNDTNGDGIGDLPGITEKLDYLADLGINYIWLTPIYVSPQYDNGYDVQDYLKINPEYGTMKDFEHLVNKANSLGIEIMLDMVLNHTSIYHDWFQKAIKGDKKYQDYYIFKDSKEETTNWESKFGGNAWEYVEKIDKWYLHLFDVTQADTNWENDRLRQELFNIVNFWKEKGVKGFRFDVINLISKPDVFEDDTEGDGRKFYTDGPSVHEYIKEMNNNTFGSQKEFATVGEMSSTSLENCVKYTNPEREELMMTFNFHHLKIDYKNGDKWELKKPDLFELKEIYKEWSFGMQNGNGWMANFISNHDQPRHVSRFGNDEEYWYESATSLALMYILLRGTPFIYYGEEIGMKNAGFKSINDFNDIESHNWYKILIEERGKSPEEALHIIQNRSRDNGRIPMQWNSSENAGFTSGLPWLKVSSQYKEVNFEKDKSSEKSIFNWYKTLIDLRKNNEAFKSGTIFFNNSEEGVISYNREYNNEIYSVIINMEDSIKNINKISGKILLNNYNDFYQGELKPYQALLIKREE